MTDPEVGSVPRDKDRVSTSTSPQRHRQPLLLPKPAESSLEGCSWHRHTLGAGELSIELWGLHMPCVFLQPQASWASQKGPLNCCMQASNAFTMPLYWELFAWLWHHRLSSSDSAEVPVQHA